MGLPQRAALVDELSFIQNPAFISRGLIARGHARNPRGMTRTALTT